MGGKGLNGPVLEGSDKSHCASEDESHDGFMAFQVYPDRTRLVP